MDKHLYPLITEQVASTTAGGQAIIVMTDSGNVTVLNELGTHIWQICDGVHNIEQIVQEITDEYEVESSTVLKDVTEFLQQMVDMQALVLDDKPESDRANIL
jgi:hypothetical protein